MFFSLYKRAEDAVFDDFPKISDHFSKISEDFPKLFRRPDEHFRTFPNIFRRLPKIAEGNRRCFDHTPPNFSVVEGTREKCYLT